MSQLHSIPYLLEFCPRRRSRWYLGYCLPSFRCGLGKQKPRWEQQQRLQVAVTAKSCRRLPAQCSVVLTRAWQMYRNTFEVIQWRPKTLLREFRLYRWNYGGRSQFRPRYKQISWSELTPSTEKCRRSASSALPSLLSEKSIPSVPRSKTFESRLPVVVFAAGAVATVAELAFPAVDSTAEMYASVLFKVRLPWLG